MQRQELFNVVDADGLICSESPAPIFPGRRLQWVVLVVFVLVVFGTPLIDLVAPAPPIKLLGLERIQDLRLRKAARFWDGSLFKLWEHDLRLRSRVRRWATDRYGWLLYRRLGHVRRDLIVGKDGWLFLRRRVMSPGNLASSYLTNRAVTSIEAIHRRLGALGFQAVFVPIPRKSAILADLLPASVDSRPDVDRMIVKEVIERGIPSVDVWELFSEDLDDPPYHLLGSHWADEAQFVTAKAVAEVFRKLNSVDPDGISIRESDVDSNDVDTDLLGLAGIDGHHRLPEESVRKLILTPTGSGRKIDEEVDDSAPIVLVGTSFSHGRRFFRYLSLFTGCPVADRSAAAVFPGVSLAGFLRDRHGMGSAKRVIIEMPCHHLIEDPVARLVAPVFELRPPRGVVRYFSLDPPSDGGGGTEGSHGKRGRVLAKIREGRVVHSGDGVVGLRLRGTVEREIELVLSAIKGQSVRFRWKPDLEEIILPFVVPGPAGGPVWLAAFPVSEGGEVSLDLESVDVVSEVSPRPRIDMEFPPPTAVGDGWESSIDAPDVAMTGTSLLELALGVSGSFSHDLSIEVSAADGSVEDVVAWERVTGGALVVVSLSRFSGKKLGRIRLSGSGAPPRRLIHRAVLRVGR